jgi:Gpi18-like mannosyltransferase
MLFNSIVKIPFLISDIAIGFLLYKIVEELTNNKELAEKAALFWFLNPFVIWVSAVWGMWDTLPALFSLAAFYFLLKKRISLSAVCLSLGVALKLYPVLFLVPIGVFLFKSNSAGNKFKSILQFFSVFLVTTILLFLPYLSTITSFFNASLELNPVATGALTNQLTHPVAFGLTYWSLFQLNQLINLPVTSGFVSFVSIFSVGLVAAALLFIYFQTSKMTFQKPAYDLALVMVLPLLALFLSYRIISEQWFVWALPFLVILCVAGRVKGAFYWGASVVALIYVVLNCPLPFFFLPLAPWYTNTLLSMVYAVWSIGLMRFVFLAVLGCIFSIVLILMIIQLLKTRELPKINERTT